VAWLNLRAVVLPVFLTKLEMGPKGTVTSNFAFITVLRSFQMYQARLPTKSTLKMVISIHLNQQIKM